MNDFLGECARAVLDGDRETARRHAESVLERGLDILDAIDGGFASGIRVAGERFEAGEYFLPELAFSAEAMKAAMSVLQPALLASGASSSRGTVVIGTVQGDIHDIGKSLVATMFLASNYHVIDLGADVAHTRFVDEIRDRSPRLLCLSALLTTTMTGQADVIRLLVESNLRERVRVLVGGAPTSDAWSQKIGADGHAHNAVAAVRMADALLEVQSDG